MLLVEQAREYRCVLMSLDLIHSLTIHFTALHLAWVIHNHNRHQKCSTKASLLSSAQHRSIDVIDILVDYPGCIANLKNNEGNTPLHLAVMLVDDELEELDDDEAIRLDVVDVLLEKMIDDRVNLGYGPLCRNDY